MQVATELLTIHVRAPIFDTPQRNGSKHTAWRKQKMRALVRDNFCCQAPGCQVDRMSLLTVHHITPRCKGGLDNLDNLITLCKRHHDTFHHGEQTHSVTE